jgi:hypothetical protein
MLGYLTKGGSQPIESFQLQILCQSIEQYVARSADYFIEPGDVGDPEHVFRDYYDNQIGLIEDKAEQLAARRLIEEGLVYEKEQRRLTLFDVQIAENYGISDDLLRRLVDTHLLRAEPNLRGGYTYELSHDTLVAPVLKAKARRIEGELRFVLAVVSIVTSVMAFQQSHIAGEAKERAEQAQAKAEQSLRDLKQKQVEEYLKKADTHRLTGESRLELKMLQAALQVDSTRSDLHSRAEKLKGN